MTAPKPPAHARLADVGRENLWALVDLYAGPPWAATYERDWERGRSTWRAVLEALSRAAGGERPPGPAEKAPRFLRPLVAERLDALATQWSHDGGFDEVRLLERLGLVTPDHDDTYVLAVVGGLGDPRGIVGRAALLREDPDLLDVVWRFFEVEGGGEVSLANRDKYSGGTSWKRDLAELVTDGTLARERVLSSCVQALSRDFSAFRAGWFSAFLESLAPSADELASLQPQLRRLLGSHVTATVSVAVRALKAVSAAGLLDDDASPELTPALVGRTRAPHSRCSGCSALLRDDAPICRPSSPARRRRPWNTPMPRCSGPQRSCSTGSGPPNSRQRRPTTWRPRSGARSARPRRSRP